MRNPLLFILLFSATSLFAQNKSTSGEQHPTSIIIGKLTAVSPKISEIKYKGAVPRKEKSRNFGEKDPVNKRVRFPVDNPRANSKDSVVQLGAKTIGRQRSITAPMLTFDGCVSDDNRTLYGNTMAPPDPNMCVGPNHVVQMVNSAHKIFDKSGNLLAGPTKFSSIATMANDDGDPIVLYDHLADRWLLMQFNLPSGGESLIFCISQTNDPTGAYYVYEFKTPGVFPDYPHIGIWHNSYVITTHEFNLSGTAYLGQGFYVVDRKKMIQGVPTSTLIRFQAGDEGGYLPVSFEGTKTPESTSQPMFFSFNADEFGGTDELWLRTLTPDFVNPSASTLSARTALPTASFDGRSPYGRTAIEQGGTTSNLDAIADRMMSRVIYRRFDNSESLVMNYVVNVSGSYPSNGATYQAAMRWYELTRPTPTSNWSIKQQSTYAPTGVGNGETGDNRWMGSIGIDQKGNIGMGYSRSSSSTHPSIYYAQRLSTDPLNTLQPEQLFHASTGSQVSTGNRWGDYSSMATDPSDEETLWYTNEYYSTTTSFNFRTRIGKFKISEAPTTPTVHFKKGGIITRQEESTLLLSGRYYKDYTIPIMIDQAPSQAADITITQTGTATQGVDYDLIIPSPFTLNSTNLSKDIILRVYDDQLGEADEYVNLSYSMNVNGGNAVSADYNQQFRITIIGKTVCPSVTVAATRSTTFCEGDSTILQANIDPNYTYQWYKDNVAIAGQTTSQLIVKASGSYHIVITQAGCSMPSTPINVFRNIGVAPPVTVSRTIAFGTTITAGNGLQATSTCTGSHSAIYSGPTIGYDGGRSSGTDPQVNLSGAGTNLVKLRISITWRKKNNGDETTCGSPSGNSNPYNNEVSFKLQAPDGTIRDVLIAGTYLSGGTPAGLVTTLFEDGAVNVGSVPANGTFAPAQSFAVFNGTNPNGVWKLLPRDNSGIDPLCVEGFAVTAYTSGTGGTAQINWYNSLSGGSSLANSTEFIPTDTAPGVYTYYAQASCPASGLPCTESIRKPATLTIQNSCVSVGGSISGGTTVCSGTNSGTLTLSGHTGSVVGWEYSTDNFITSTPISNTTTTQNFTNLTRTTQYRAIVRNGSCTAVNSNSATIQVNQVLATASNTGPYSLGMTIQLNATGGSSYTWTGPNGFTSTSNPAYIAGATAAMAGNYTVTVTSAGCSATATTNVVINTTPCADIIEYDYVQAGNPFIYKFPLRSNMVIAEVPEQTSVIVNPICPSTSIESFRMKIVGLPYLHEVVESIAPFALFNNTGKDVLGRNLSPGEYTLTVTGYSQDNAQGSVVYGPVDTKFTIVSSTATISPPTFTLSSLCAGTNFTVNFSTSGYFDPSNIFEVQLSDAEGSFNNPVVIGTSPTAGVVNCTIPINIPMGSLYRIRVVSTNSVMTGNSNNYNLTSTPSEVNLSSPIDDMVNGNTIKQAAQTINASNKVIAPANVVYKAGNSILLTAGFQAQTGAVFKAMIEGCR